MLQALEDGATQPSVQVTGSKNIKAQFVDVVTLWSTIEGFVSMRNSTKGSHYIQCLCKNLLRSSSSLDEWRDLLDAHLATTCSISSGATQIEFSFKNSDGEIVKHKFWINQTPLYKSSACQKIGFRKISNREPTVYCCVSRNDPIYKTLVKHIEDLKKKMSFKIRVHNLEGSSVF